MCIEVGRWGSVNFVAGPITAKKSGSNTKLAGEQTLTKLQTMLRYAYHAYHGARKLQTPVILEPAIKITSWYWLTTMAKEQMVPS